MVTRKEIEDKIANAGDYVKLDVLSRYLKQPLDFDTRKFVMLKLSGIYENKGMFLEAGKLMRNAADLNTTFEGKINDFVKSGDLFVKAGKFDEADASFRKGMAISNSEQKVQIKISEKESYKTQTKILMKNDKRKNAMLAYEKLLGLDLTSAEKADAQKELMAIYEKLGKIREFFEMRKTI